VTTMGASPELVSLATPAGRWTPTRAGLIACGATGTRRSPSTRSAAPARPNGSGKSMALELLLPFLLDGDASPSRLTSRPSRGVVCTSG